MENLYIYKIICKYLNQKRIAGQKLALLENIGPSIEEISNFLESFNAFCTDVVTSGYNYQFAFKSNFQNENAYLALFLECQHGLVFQFRLVQNNETVYRVSWTYIKAFSEAVDDFKKWMEA